MRDTPATRRGPSVTGRPAAAGTATRRQPTRGLTEGAILAALTVVVAAAGLIAPFVGILLAPLPIMLLVIRWGIRTALLATVVAAWVLLQFFGPLNAISAVATFAPLGLALGWGVRRGIGAQFTILAGAAAFLGSTLAVLEVTMIVLHQDLIEQFIRGQVQAMQTALAVQERLGAPQQQVDELRLLWDTYCGEHHCFAAVMPQFFHTALPVMLAFGALLWGYLSYTVARAVLRRVGHTLPAVPPIVTWHIPPLLASILLWISAGISLVSLRDPRASGMALDAMFVDLFVFGFQGALVGIAWMNNRQIPRFAQVMAGVLLLMTGLLPMMALAVLGIMDSWFDYRRLRRTQSLVPPSPAPDQRVLESPPSGPDEHPVKAVGSR